MKIIDRFYDGLKYALTGSNSRTEDLESKLERSIESANVDYITGVYNRRGFYDLVNRELRRKIRDSERIEGIDRINIQLIYFDIDNFKEINDFNGHDIGDKVLKDFSGMLLNSCRREDIVARIGGDEFVYFASHHNESDYNDLILKLIPLVRQYNSTNSFKGWVKLDFSYGILIKNLYIDNFRKGRGKIDGFLNVLTDYWLRTADKDMYKMKNRKKMHMVETKSAKA
nr:GGDEF domain-containing protein [Candidatus Woesearchaeota archaeon]